MSLGRFDANANIEPDPPTAGEVIQASVSWIDCASRMALCIEQERWNGAKDAAKDFRLFKAYFGPDGKPRTNLDDERGPA